MNYENNQQRQWSSSDVACETGKGHFPRGAGEPVVLRTCPGMLSSSCLLSAGLGWLSLSVIQGGWGILMSSSVCRSWWGRDCRDTQTHVVHPSQLYHLWHANDNHVNWGHANQSHANQGHANQGPANEVSPGHWSSILGKGLDYWDVALWCQLTTFQG